MKHRDSMFLIDPRFRVISKSIKKQSKHKSKSKSKSKKRPSKVKRTKRMF